MRAVHHPSRGGGARASVPAGDDEGQKVAKQLFTGTKRDAPPRGWHRLGDKTTLLKAQGRMKYNQSKQQLWKAIRVTRLGELTAGESTLTHPDMVGAGKLVVMGYVTHNDHVQSLVVSSTRRAFLVGCDQGKLSPKGEDDDDLLEACAEVIAHDQQPQYP